MKIVGLPISRISHKTRLLETAITEAFEQGELIFVNFNFGI